MGLVVKNVIPEARASDIRDLFLRHKWKYEPFIDASYYKTQYRDTISCIPKEDEVYTTSFSKCHELTSNIEVLNTVYDYIVPFINSAIAHQQYEVDTSTVSLLAYRLKAGDHLRLHNDNYAAHLGFIWYLSKEWRWDWGGLLLSVNSDGSASVEIPEFNKLVVLNHSESVTHCVTSVEKWALEDRLMLVGFMRVKK